MFNNKSTKSLRKKLRNDLSPVEVLLWARLKNKQLNGFKFRRQYSVGRYVLDFYCVELRLGIEIDEEDHFIDSDKIRYDKTRDEFMSSQDIKMLHVTGKEINENLEGVMGAIIEHLP